MLILNPNVFFDYCVLLVLVVLTGLGFWIASRTRGIIRPILVVLSVFVFIGGVFITAAARIGSDLTSYSVPIYSPDHKHALLIEDVKVDHLARTTVYLYSNHGLVNNRVFYGSQGSVTINDVHWINDSAVLITYHPLNAKQYCASTREIKVTVEPNASAESKHGSSTVRLDVPKVQ